MLSARLSESATLRVCRGIRDEYRTSRVRSLSAGLGRKLGAKCRESLLFSLLSRDGSLSRLWGSSLLCRLLAYLLGLPGLLLGKLYRRFRPAFDESLLAGLIFEAGDGAALMGSWVILLLWIIPFRYWDNTYHLLGYLLVLGLLWLRQMRRGTRLRLDSVGFYPVLLLLGVVLSIFLSQYPGLSARYLRYHLICAVCVLTTVNSIRSGRELKRFAFAAAGVVLVSAVYGLVQRVQGVDIVSVYVDASVNEGMPGRVQSYFDNPNTYAQVLVMLLPLAGASMLCAKRHVPRIAAAAALVLGIAAIGMTYSRSSWIGLAVELVVFVLLWKPKLFPPLVILAILCVPFLPDTILNRILTIGRASQDTSVTTRFPLYRAGLRVVGRLPLTGAGLGAETVQRYIAERELFDVTYDSIQFYAHLHDVFLQVWAESGVVGVAGFVGSMLWGLKGMGRAALRGGSRTVRLLTIACLSATVGSLTIGIVDYIWAYPRVMCIFWLVFALGLAGVRLLREGEDG